MEDPKILDRGTSDSRLRAALSAARPLVVQHAGRDGARRPGCRRRRARLDQVDLESQTVKTIAEITLSLMLFHDAVRIDLRALRRGFAVPLRLLGIGLPLMLVLGTAAAWWMLPSIGLVGAVLVATMLAPTDAALGAAVVEDERLPMRIRQGLNVESGLNDGLSVPVFLVALALAADPTGWEPGALGAELMRQIGFGVLGGLLVGGLGGLAFRFAAEKGLMRDYWRQVANPAAALGCFVAAAVLGGSGFIGAFAGGIVFGLASEARSVEDNALTGYLGAVFDALSFLLVGAMLIPFALADLTWPVVVYAVLSLVVIRAADGRWPRWPAAAPAGRRSPSWDGSVRVGWRPWCSRYCSSTRASPTAT